MSVGRMISQVVGEFVGVGISALYARSLYLALRRCAPDNLRLWPNVVWPLAISRIRASLHAKGRSIWRIET